MAFFKFRPGAKAGSDESANGADTQTIKHLRRQARHRLIGAAVLVVLAVAGFPMVFDTQPRPVSVDLAIDIPSKGKVSPDTPPAPLAPGSGSPTAAANSEELAKQALSEKEELVVNQEPATEAPKELSKEAVPAATKSTPDGAKPSAQSSTAAKTIGDARFVVQVGVFLEDSKVRETRGKLEKAGLITYTQVVDAKDGKRTRVRLGPFNSKAEAEAAADKAKSLNLPAIILTY
ncbi:MAG: SPOR domain-containing protein [Alphaproteobacteria bacterium]|nr:SPOR domain-containing protein [Alphaproteobacteria bacterium]